MPALSLLHLTAAEAGEALGCTGSTADASACPQSGSAGQEDSSRSRSSSQGAAHWPSNGPCDWHPDCRLCREEQQKGQRQPDSSTSSSSSSQGLCFPVPYDDPFLMRRLLWRLLGKLSPEAQAYLAKHARMCPHCDDDT